jgi:hypothetical protein
LNASIASSVHRRDFFTDKSLIDSPFDHN